MKKILILLLISSCSEIQIHVVKFKKYTVNNSFCDYYLDNTFWIITDSCSKAEINDTVKYYNGKIFKLKSK